MGKPGRPKGYPKTGGRKKGVRNKRTVEIQERLDAIFSQDDGWQHYVKQFAAGEMPIPLIIRLMEYAYGKPKDSIELSGPDGGPMEHVAKLSTSLLRKMREELASRDS